MDGRTLEEFARYLSLGHAKERVYAAAFHADAIARGFRNCGYRDLGVDNSGRVIKGRLHNHNPDYKFWGIEDEDSPLEVKANVENPRFMTFKKDSLDSCIIHKARILSPTTIGYHILSTPAMKIIMAKCRCRNDHSGFKEKWAYRAGIGNCPKSILAAERAGLTPDETGLVDRLMAKGLVMYRTWTPQAMQIINRHRALLLKRYYKPVGSKPIQSPIT